MSQKSIEYPCMYFDEYGHIGYIGSNLFFESIEEWMLDDDFTINSNIFDRAGNIWTIAEIINKGESGNLFLRMHNRITNNITYKLELKINKCGHIEFPSVLDRICKSLEKGEEHWINDELAAGEGGAPSQDWPAQLAWFTGRIRAAKTMQDLKPIFDNPYAGILKQRPTES